MNPNDQTLKYSLTQEDRKRFAGLYLLDYMVAEEVSFPILLNENDESLEEILGWLLSRDYVLIKDKEQYEFTDKGRDAAFNFIARYKEFLKFYDIFCAVDLEQGSFAFSSYFEFEDSHKWQSYLQQDNWNDLRVAVAELKKVDPIEIVFMSYLNEDRFGREGNTWQFDLLLGSIWDDILDICNNAIHVDDLGFEDEEGIVEGTAVMEDVIKQGSQLMLELIRKDKDEAPDKKADDNNDSQEEVDYVEYYEEYMDPYYVSPYWNRIW